MMMVHRIARALLLALPRLAGACSLGDAVGRHGAAYIGSVETATDTVLVMNIILARRAVDRLLTSRFEV